MLIEQINEFELRGHGPLTVHGLLQLVIFMTKQTSLKKSSSRLSFTAKILQEVMYFTSPSWAKPLTKFNTKMQDFKRVLDLNRK